MKYHLSGILFLSAFVLITSLSHASAVYRYQGENYENPFGSYDTTMSLTGTVEFATPLPPNLFGEVFPIGFSYNDGVNTYMDEDIESARFGFATNPLGEIIGWEVLLMTTEALDFVYLVSENTMLGGQDSIPFSFSEGEFVGGAWSSSPGSWSLVPVPPALWLFGSGLLGLVGMARRNAV
jgi:hypothetical protein